MKSALDGLISRLNTTEERIPELEDMAKESSNTEKQKDQRLKKKKAEHNTQGLWNNCRRSNIGIMGTPAREEREKETEEMSETIVTENFPK